MENQSNFIRNNSNRTIHVGLSYLSNLKTKKECRWFSQKMGKYSFSNLGLFFPPYSCFDVDFILQFGDDKKKVSFSKFLIH